MTVKKLQKWSRIEIEWVDSTHTSGWANSCDYEGEPQIDHRTIGYVLQVTNKTITVVQSMNDCIKEDGSRTVDNVMDIPKVAIKRIKKL